MAGTGIHTSPSPGPSIITAAGATIEDYGWFWVPGDTWAPAWVQWRYSDDYVGWAPIGPGRRGYAYGVPVNYDPPIAESWVFVQPRYMTSRAISHYALPIGGLGVAFFGATHVYRPIYRGGIVYNYGMPRDRVVQITRRPIYVQKIYKTNNWKGGHFDRDDRNKGIKIYAPRFSKDGRPNRGPKKFADNPNDFRPKAKLRDTYKGDVPKGWGPSARGVKSIAKEDPDAFKKKHDFDGRDFGDRGKNNDRDNDRNNDKGQASKDFDRDNRDKDTKKGFGSQGGPDQFKQGNRDQDDQGGGGQRKQKDFGPPRTGRPRSVQAGEPSTRRRGGGEGKKKTLEPGTGGPISSSRATATRMIRAAVASASRRTLVRQADREAPISSSRATAIILTKVAAARARRRSTSGSQVDLVGPISSSRATATRMIRAAVASASRRTLAEADLAVLEAPAASSNSTRAADRPKAIKVAAVAAATRSARSTPKSQSVRAATRL